MTKSGGHDRDPESITPDRPMKPLVLVHGEIKTPPFSKEARIEAGCLLLRLQLGESLGMPASRPMPSVGPRCHEIRIVDENRQWRVVYRIDADAVLVLDVFPKTTRKTPDRVIATCKERCKAYDVAAKARKSKK